MLHAPLYLTSSSTPSATLTFKSFFIYKLLIMCKEKSRVNEIKKIGNEAPTPSQPLTNRKKYDLYDLEPSTS